MKTAEEILLDAGRIYSKCAKIVDKKIASANFLSKKASERVVGLGIASDWVRRAGGMNEITFATAGMNKSSWKRGFEALIRYGFAWSGINAIFARNELLTLIGPLPDPDPKKVGELKRFRILFSAASIPVATITAREGTLHAILSTPVPSRIPLAAPGTTATTLHAFNAKYVPPDAQEKGVGKDIKTAVTTGSINQLDLPILLYAFRNWSVHGNALYGSFGSKPRFESYVEVLTETLAEVHLATAERLVKIL